MLIRDYMRWPRKSNGRGKIVIGALAGVAAGLTAGLLAAPRSGRETRTILSTRANETIDKVGKNLNRTGQELAATGEEELEKTKSDFR